MRNFKRVLIAGTGPSSVQLAISLKKILNCDIGISGRRSARAQHFFTSLRQSGRLLRASVQNDNHHRMAGECSADYVFEGYENVEGSWDTLILSVTTDAYLEVMKQLPDSVVKQLACVVLISPTLGSNTLVSGYMKSIHANGEVVSCSTYYGDTRWIHDAPSGHVITAAVKKRIYLGSTCYQSVNIDILSHAFDRLGIVAAEMETPIEAETRNISLYVHPPLFMNDFSLRAVFDEPDRIKYVYKMYPEGPITQHLIRDMLAQWKEILNILKALNIKGINLLQFMTDDNYPVRSESLSRHDIDNFDRVETIHQEYLLYIRYASLLIDPFSEPDEAGKYFDFSAVPFRKLFINRDGRLDIPRMPKEDYYRLKIIQGIARHLKVGCPTIDRFLRAYQAKIAEVAESLKGRPLSQAFAVQQFHEDVNIICSSIH